MPTDALRVLHISTWNVPCGIATYAAQWVEALQAEGVQNEVFELRPHDWLVRRPGVLERWCDEVRLRAADCDLVHVQHEHGLFGAARSHRFAVKVFGRLLSTLQQLRKPVLTTFHTDPSRSWDVDRTSWTARGIKKFHQWNWSRLWKSHVFRRFGAGRGQARALVHTNETLNRFLEVGAPDAAFDVVAHPCRITRRSPLSPAEAKAVLGLPPGTRLLSTFGFVSRYKGADLALEALRLLPEDFHLAIVGGAHPNSADPYLDELLGRIQQSGLQSRARITGYVEPDAAARWFAAADVCLAPYRTVGGNLSASGAVTWALSSGKPTIASKIEAFQAVQREQECFFMVSPESPRELAWAVEKLLADAPLQRRLTTAAAEYCGRNSWSEAVRRTLPLYERMTGKPARRSAASGEGPRSASSPAELQRT